MIVVEKGGFAVNSSNRTHDFVDLLAKISADRGLVFTTADAQKLKDTGYAIQGGTVNGVYDNGTVTLNINSPKALNSVVGHEVVHAMEGSDFYAPLRDAVVAYAEKTGEYDTRLKAIKDLYTGKPGYETDFDSKAERELVADLIGDYVFSDPEFVRNLSVSNRNLFQKLYDEIKYLLKVATAGSKEARALEKVKKTFEDAYRETKNTAQPDGVKYALAKIEDITPSQEQIEKNIIDVANMNSVHSIDESALDDSGKNIFEIYDEHFSSWGYNVSSNIFGDVAVNKSGIKSDRAHGSTREKIASIEAIPSVIQNGKIIDWFTKHNNDVYRITVAAPIRIGETPYIMGVMLQRDNQNQRLYLHDVILEKEASELLQDDRSTTGSNKSGGNLYTTNILQKVIDVKENKTQGINERLSLSKTVKQVPQSGSNIYGSDVAVESREETVPAAKRSKVDYSKVAPTKEDIALMEQEKASQSEDGMQTLIRALDEIRTQSTRQAPEPETRAKAEKIVGDRNAVIRDRDVTNETEPTATEGVPQKRLSCHIQRSRFYKYYGGI